MDGSKKLKTQKRDSKGLSFLYYILKENRFIYKQKNNKMAENKRLLILGKSGGNGIQVQSDWAETDTESVSYIKNKPEMTTQTLTFVDENNVETNVVVYTQPTV